MEKQAHLMILIKKKMAINKDNVNHAKRHWAKGSFYFLDISTIQYGYDKKYTQLLMYMSDRKICFKVFNPEVLEVLKQANPKEKLRVWYSVESKLYSGRWYTDLTLKHVEIPRLDNLNKAKEEYETSGGFDFGKHAEDF